MAHVLDAPEARRHTQVVRLNWPFVTVPIAIMVMRIGVALLFMAHAIVRVLTRGAIESFTLFMRHAGIPQGRAVVLALTTFEIVGGLLLIAGVRTRVMAAGFSVILVVGIALIHWRLGWFVGEHGTGGSEYSVALLLALLVIMAADAESATHRARAAVAQRPNAA